MRRTLIAVMAVAISLLISVGMVSANPGIVVSVTPIQDSVLAGETAEYEVTVNSIEALGMDTEIVTLDVNNKIAGATYTFSGNGFEIGPHPDTETVTMTIDVSSTTASGTYPQTVTAEAEWLGIPCWEYSEFTTYIDVQIPEFPTVALPVVAVIGLLLLMRRRKE